LQCTLREVFAAWQEHMAPQAEYLW
jgi:hypothetical protein